MGNSSKRHKEITVPQSKFARLRFEVITTCCAAFFGAIFFGAVFWFSGMGEWVAEASFIGGIVCGVMAATVHALLYELDKMAKERHKNHD